MDLPEAVRDVERNLDAWHEDLKEIDRALDHARESLRDVKDAGTAEKFSRFFEDFKKPVDNLNREIGSLSGKVKNLEAEAAKASEEKK